MVDMEGASLVEPKALPTPVLLVLVGVAGITLGWYGPKAVQSHEALAIGLGLGLIALLGIGVKLDALGKLLPPLLAFSFVLSGWREDIGFIVMEPWQIVMALCILSWPLGLAKEKLFSIRLDSLGVWGLLVVAGAWLSFFGALDEMTWFKRAVRILLLFVVYLYLVSHVKNRDDMIVLLQACLCGCAVSSVVLIGEFIDQLHSGSSFDMNEWSGANNGTFANTNEGSTYVSMFTVLALALLFMRTHRQLMRSHVFAIVVGLCIISVILARSRTGMIALASVTAALYIVSQQKGYLKRIVHVTVIAAVSVAGVLSLGPARLFVVRFLATFGASGDIDYDQFVQAGVLVRGYLIDVYWAAFTLSPVFGIGAANYGFMGELDLNLPPPPEGAYWGDMDKVDHYLGFSSHNGFLNWLTETGVVGFFPFVISLTFAGTVLVRLFRESGASLWWRALGAGMCGALAVFVITNLTGDFGVSEARYWLLLALTSIAYRLSQESYELDQNCLLCTYGRRQRSE